MGGSLIVNGIEAAPINLNQGCAVIYEIIDKIGQFSTGWADDVAREEYMAGSTLVAVNNRICLRNMDYKLGDVDLFVDKDCYQTLIEELQGADIDTIYIVPNSIKAGKLRTTMLMRVGGVAYQVDLIAVPFDDGKPRQFYVWSHSSTIEDLEHGVKGCYHKLLLRAFARYHGYHLSVDYGLRKEGSEKYNDKFEDVVNRILMCNKYQSWSFISLMKVLDRRPKEEKEAIINRFADLAFGHDRQKTSRNDDLDRINQANVFLVITHFQNVHNKYVAQLYHFGDYEE